MKEFFLILFFSKTILLTEVPIDIDGAYIINTKEEISAITQGAGILIDVSSMIKYTPGSNIASFRKRLMELLPENTIRARLLAQNGKEVVLIYDGGCSFNNEEVLIYLFAEGGIPLDIKFDQVELESDVKLRSVRVLWKNYKH